jgi:hypothetical protein
MCALKISLFLARRLGVSCVPAQGAVDCTADDNADDADP